jgi:hypothetical protein
MIAFPLVLLALLLPVAGSAQQQHCLSQPKVVVLNADVVATAEICHASDRAITFLAQFDLTPIRTISFKVNEQQIDHHAGNIYGNYDSRNEVIQIMSYAAIQKGATRPMIFGEHFDKVHYSAAIAHEIAHAVVQQNINRKLLNSAAQEYLAYVTQLAVLPAERRTVIIKAMDVGPWTSGDSISDIYMAMNPGKFAVKSYLHLTTMAEPGSFILILLNSNWLYINVP